MKSLTERQAARCENAVHPRCRCRCRGLAHGRQRYFKFGDLPEGDPHRLFVPGGKAGKKAAA